jgi:hypothetical protein
MPLQEQGPDDPGEGREERRSHKKSRPEGRPFLVILPVDMEHVTGAQHDHHCFVILAFARWRIVGQYGYVVAVDAPILIPYIQIANRSADLHYVKIY